MTIITSGPIMQQAAERSVRRPRRLKLLLVPKATKRELSNKWYTVYTDAVVLIYTTYCIVIYSVTSIHPNSCLYISPAVNPTLPLSHERKTDQRHKLFVYIGHIYIYSIIHEKDSMLEYMQILDMPPLSSSVCPPDQQRWSATPEAQSQVTEPLLLLLISM